MSNVSVLRKKKTHYDW